MQDGRPGGGDPGGGPGRVKRTLCDCCWGGGQPAVLWVAVPLMVGWRLLMSGRFASGAATLTAAADEETAQADDEIVAMWAVTQRHGNRGSLFLKSDDCL